MKYENREWFPQLDVYDGIRRVCLILNNWTYEPIAKEHLFIIDFFLSTPSLLHKISMRDKVRKEFLPLKITKPKDCFIAYPSPQMLFHKMAPVQHECLNALFGKNMLERELYSNGCVHLNDNGEKVVKHSIAPLVSQNEGRLLEFMVHTFSIMGRDSMQVLRNRTGLRRGM